MTHSKRLLFWLWVTVVILVIGYHFGYSQSAAAQEIPRASLFAPPTADTPEAWMARARLAHERYAVVLYASSVNATRKNLTVSEAFNFVEKAVEDETVARLTRFGARAIPVCLPELNDKSFQKGIALSVLANLGDISVGPMLSIMPATLKDQPIFILAFRKMQGNPANELAKIATNSPASSYRSKNALRLLAFFIDSQEDQHSPTVLILKPHAVDMRFRLRLLSMLARAKTIDEKVNLLLVQNYFSPADDFTVNSIIGELQPLNGVVSTESRKAALEVLQKVIADSETSDDSKLSIEVALAKLLNGREKDAIKIAASTAAGNIVGKASTDLINALQKCVDGMSRPVRLAALPALCQLSKANASCIRDVAIALNEDDENTQWEAKAALSSFSATQKAYVARLQKADLLK
ncbi:MAG: hypothetical protein KGS72_02245 [Cyanobacteria bacterium REEB67]|nr:hypothetical protein [Cyanobacteria bacterium REEB67]